MSYLLICTGKKKHVDAIYRYFLDLGSQKLLEIHAKNLVSKKVVIWEYDELKLLFETRNREKVQIERRLVKAVDFVSVKACDTLALRMKSPRVEDDWLRYRMVQATAPFQLAGGMVILEEKVEKSGAYRTFRIIQATLSGSLANVLAIKDQLEREGLLEPNSVEYLI